MGGGTLRPPRKRRMASARVAFQRQRAVNMGASSMRLRQHILHGLRLQKFEDDLERKGVLLAQRDHDAVVGGGGLQLEVERAAEALAQRQAPGAIDARAERRVDDQLHAAGFVEEALGDDGRVRGHRAQRGRAGLHVGDGLLGAALVERRIRASEIRWLRGAGARRCLRAAGRLRAKARRCGRALRRARTESTARRRAHPPRARARLRRAGCARKWCPAGRRRPPGSRRRNLRRAFRPRCLPARR